MLVIHYVLEWEKLLKGAPKFAPQWRCAIILGFELHIEYL